MAYAVVRTDLMSGTDVRSDLRSGRFYDANDKLAEIENGVIVKVGDLEVVDATKGIVEREIFKVTAAAAADVANVANLALVATPELMYLDEEDTLDKFINKEGMPVRLYRLRGRDIFSVTAEGFDGNAPAKGDKVTIGNGGKLKVGTTNVLGSCIHIETKNGKVYYAIRVEA